MAVDLCRNFGLVQLIPLALADVDPEALESQAGSPNPDPAFWKAREGELRRHDEGQNKVLGAMWFSGGQCWTFRSGSGPSVGCMPAPTEGHYVIFVKRKSAGMRPRQLRVDCCE